MSPFILLVGIIVGVSAYSTGPPLSACNTLSPGHVTSTGNLDPVPYKITISEEMYGPMSTIIQVTLQQTAPDNDFRGFILQARRTSGDATAIVGRFSSTLSSGTQLLDCTYSDSTLTHNDSDAKQSVSISWTAPNDDEGTLRFRATVVVAFSTYYEDIMSNDLVYDAATSTETRQIDSQPDCPATHNQTGLVYGLAAGMIIFIMLFNIILGIHIRYRRKIIAINSKTKTNDPKSNGSSIDLSSSTIKAVPEYQNSSNPEKQKDVYQSLDAMSTTRSEYQSLDNGEQKNSQPNRAYESLNANKMSTNPAEYQIPDTDETKNNLIYQEISENQVGQEELLHVDLHENALYSK